MTKTKLTEVQKERIGEAINRFFNGTGFNGKSLYDIYPTIQSIINQQTASLYTLSEVQKIVENVREACSQIPDSKYDYANILKLDLNQFIKK